MAKLSDIGKIVTQALQSNTALNNAGKSMKRAITKRTRLGYGVSENGADRHKLPNLSPKTVENRKRLKKAGKLTGPKATPGKSGLNRTGEMLESIKYASGKGKLEIRLGDAKQEQKAQDLVDLNPNYEFMNLSKPEIVRMIKAMTGTILGILKKIKFTDL